MPSQQPVAEEEAPKSVRTTRRGTKASAPEPEGDEIAPRRLQLGEGPSQPEPEAAAAGPANDNGDAGDDSDFDLEALAGRVSSVLGAYVRQQHQADMLREAGHAAGVPADSFDQPNDDSEEDEEEGSGSESEGGEAERRDSGKADEPSVPRWRPELEDLPGPLRLRDASRGMAVAAATSAGDGPGRKILAPAPKCVAHSPSLACPSASLVAAADNGLCCRPRRDRKSEPETAGDKWFGLPAQKIDEETKRRVGAPPPAAPRPAAAC